MEILNQFLNEIPAKVHCTKV